MTRRSAAAGESAPVRLAITLAAVGFVALFVAMPLVELATQALADGWPAALRVIRDPETGSAIRLTLLTAAISVPLNTLFGAALAWAIARHRFPGRAALSALIDLPFAVSPVVAGMLFVLLFGRQGLLGQWLDAHGVQVIFAAPGIVLVTTFVTFPFVARELAPLLEAQGPDEEQAARVLGASGWQTLWRVTLPNIRWGLLYGVALCNARAMGEFGAVSVVSGHITGLTNTLPLHVEILYNEYNFVGAFSAAALLALLAVVTLAVKALVEWRDDSRASGRRRPE